MFLAMSLYHTIVPLKMCLIKSFYVLSLIIVSLSGFEQTPTNLMNIKINIFKFLFMRHTFSADSH